MSVCLSVCPIFSLSEFRWLDAYFGAREELHLPIQGAIDFPLLPAWDGSYLLKGRALNCRAANSMLFKMLGAYSTRTFKCTLLSFMAKLLGYYLDREETSVATYSRDTLSLPLRELVNPSPLTLLSKGTFPLSAPGMWLQRLQLHPPLHLLRPLQLPRQDTPVRRPHRLHLLPAMRLQTMKLWNSRTSRTFPYGCRLSLLSRLSNINN